MKNIQILHVSAGFTKIKSFPPFLLYLAHKDGFD